MIDLYCLYLEEPRPGTLFRIGDTHWSNHGMQVWLKAVNEELKKQGSTGRTDNPAGYVECEIP